MIMGHNGLIYCIGISHLTRGIKMDFVSIRYLENDIYISLKDSQEENIVLSDLKNIYVSYKIKAFHKAIKETVMIKRENLTLFDRLLILIFSLSNIHSVEETQIEIEQIKIIFQSSDNRIIQVNESFSLLEIQAHDVKHDRNREFKNNFFKNSNDKIKNDKYSSLKPIQGTPKELFTNEISTSPGAIFERIEEITKKQTKSELEKIDLDMETMFYNILILILSILPKPNFFDEYQSGRAVIQSLQKYIKNALIERGGEV